MRRVKCYFCDQVTDHGPICVVNNRVSEKQYIAGFKAGLQPDPAIRSSHPMFFKGWCRGLRMISNPDAWIKKKPS